MSILGRSKTKITETTPEHMRNAFPDRPETASDKIAWMAAEGREWLDGRYVSRPWDMRELLDMNDAIVEKDKLPRHAAQKPRIFVQHSPHGGFWQALSVGGTDDRVCRRRLHLVPKTDQDRGHTARRVK